MHGPRFCIKLCMPSVGWVPDCCVGGQGQLPQSGKLVSEVAGLFLSVYGRPLRRCAKSASTDKKS